MNSSIIEPIIANIKNILKITSVFSFLNKIKPTRFFIFAAIFFEILFNLVTPPFQAPDEFNHFYRTYQIADGNFLPERTKDRLGGEIPICFNEFILPYTFAASNLKYTFDKGDVLKGFSIPFSDKVTEFKDFPNTAYYSAVSYLPQVVGVFVLKQFNCSVATIYYGGRFCSFIFWLLIMFLVIKIVPIYKWLFTTIILLPMNIYLANSFSADTVTNCLSLLLIAIVLKQIFSKELLLKKELIIIFLIIIFLALAKLVYVGLALILFLIPAIKFKNSSIKYGYIFGVLLITSIVVYLWSSTIMSCYIRFADYNPNHIYYIGISPCGDYYAQKKYIFSHGFYFFKVIFHSIFNHPQQYLLGYIGAFGQSDIALPIWIYVVSFFLVLFLAFAENNQFKVSPIQKIVFLFAVFFSFVFLLLSQHLIWDCVGEGIVDMVQGRYLIPLFPLLFLLFNNSIFKLKINPIVLIIPFLFFINIYSVKAIFERFFIESFTSKTEFFCDAESFDKEGFLLTSNSKIKLEKGSQIVKEEYLSANNSVLISPEFPYGFTYPFENLKYGDLIEVQAWSKGEGGQFVVSGTGKNCENFFIAAKSVLKTEKNGWSKVYMVFTMTHECESSKVKFFVWNPKGENVYVDDLKFSLKKFD